MKFIKPQYLGAASLGSLFINLLREFIGHFGVYRNEILPVDI
jgi:hypothetical protein